MVQWDGTKRNKRLETGLMEDEINFSINGGGDSISNDTTRIGHIATVLKKFKNPYIGNKRKLIPFLIETIDKHNIEYESVLDLFSGSAFCSMAFKMLDKKVISNDILSCSYLNAVAFVENKDIILTKEEQDSLFEFVENYPDDIISYRYLNRLDEAEIATIAIYYNKAIEKWGSPLEGNIKSALAIVYMQNYIIEKCFVGGRLNSGQILASYEHRVDHAKNKGYCMFYNGKDFSYSDMRWTNPIYPTDKNQHKCYNMDAIDLLREVQPEVDLAYIDPPYGGSQSDYGFMYALFEEMLHGKDYEEIEEKRYGANRFIDKSNYKKNFSQLMYFSKYIPNIVISYNDTSWGTIEEICEVVEEHRRNVTVEEFDYSYKYRSKENNDKRTKEYIVIAKG